MNLVRAAIGASASTDLPLPPHMGWMAESLCLRKGLQHFWLPQERPTPKQYQEVLTAWCFQCPVRPECLVTTIRQETRLRHTSRGVQGGATPSERATLRRKIREAQICITEGVWRWLHGRTIPRPPPPRNQRYLVTLSPSTGGVPVYQHTAVTPKGAHLIAVRELRRQGCELVATVTDLETDTLLEVIPPIGQGPRRNSPSPGQ